ncbi:hypothetical protein J1N35_039381 [Gossypium stocksii]|uniref:Uncharacterized protein n=1 Tax=Gossypium stocksii TaxID=47602 RepID=A0A9D3UNP5_9ROSI|nr:hypothetical protein J1N35_039381 [Gossypium stocksii]
MGRAPCCDKNGLKKGPWTPEEDQKLVDYIQTHGYGNWRTLPKNAGLQRCGKSCRLRWTNYLRPDIKRGRFSFEEEEAIIQLHSVLGNKWSAIAARLPGRTDNEIKNYWNTHIRKRLLRMGIDPVTHSPRLDLLDLSSILGCCSFYNQSQMNMSTRLLGGGGGVQPLVNPEILRLATSIMSSPQRENQNPDFLFHENQYQQPPLMQNTNVAEPVMNNNPNVIIDQFPFNGCFTDWQNNANAVLPYLTEDNYVPVPSNCYGGGNGEPNFRTPSSSSPTPLNSNNSTYINSSSTEDESYSSDILKFEIPDFLDVNEFM